ncbi:MAG: hypothetical protein COB15_11460 [Flavobacteriales bacterium]|nr:MAG: hypothetical protein COB15_11460 [Flavobacteriales bacterium]
MDKMILQIIPVLATAIIGFFGWYFLQLRTSYVIRKSVKTFLDQVIKPVILDIKDTSEDGTKGEMDKVYDFVDLSNGYNELTTSHFPLFNSNFLKSFPMSRLRVAYRNSDRFVSLMNVIGYLDGFQNRMPNDIQKQWIDFINKHKKECEVNIRDCNAVQYQTKLFQSNIDNTRNMAKNLFEEIEKTIV